MMSILELSFTWKDGITLVTFPATIVVSVDTPGDGVEGFGDDPSTAEELAPAVWAEESVLV